MCWIETDVSDKMDGSAQDDGQVLHGGTLCFKELHRADSFKQNLNS